MAGAGWIPFHTPSDFRYIPLRFLYDFLEQFPYDGLGSKGCRGSKGTKGSKGTQSSNGTKGSKGPKRAQGPAIDGNAGFRRPTHERDFFRQM